MMKKFRSTTNHIMAMCLVSVLLLALTGCTKAGDSVNDFNTSESSSVQESTSVESTEETSNISTEDSTSLDPDVESSAISEWESSEAVESQEVEPEINRDEIAKEKVNRFLDEYKIIMNDVNTIEKNIMLDFISAFSWAEWAWFEVEHTAFMNLGDVYSTDGKANAGSLEYAMCLYFYNHINEIDNNFFVSNWMKSNTNDYEKMFFGNSNSDDNWADEQNSIPFFSACLLAEYLYQHDITLDTIPKVVN